MSQQIAIVGEGVDLFDLALDPDNTNHLLLDESFKTATLISILTDRRCDPSEAPDPSDLGGWWGDSYPDEPGDAIGSRLWTLTGAKATADLLPRAEGYVRECLQWLVDDGIVESQDSIQIELEFGGHTLSGRVTILQPRAPLPAWSVAWSRTLA